MKEMTEAPVKDPITDKMVSNVWAQFFNALGELSGSIGSVTAKRPPDVVEIFGDVEAVYFAIGPMWYFSITIDGSTNFASKLALPKTFEGDTMRFRRGYLDYCDGVNTMKLAIIDGWIEGFPISSNLAVVSGWLMREEV